MDYQFSFSRSRLLLLCAAMLFAGLLTFVGGVVTGIGLWMPRAGKTIAAKLPEKFDPAAKLEAAKSAVEIPALPEVKLPESLTALMPGSSAPSSAVPATTAPAPDAPHPGAAPAVNPTSDATPPPSGAAAASAAMPDITGQPFVLQLGAFREQKNAKVLQTSLKERGYTATILNMVDEDQRTWHMVRLGGYKDLSAASKAAFDFTGKEGIQALVRRSDAL